MLEIGCCYVFSAAVLLLLPPPRLLLLLFLVFLVYCCFVGDCFRAHPFRPGVVYAGFFSRFPGVGGLLGPFVRKAREQGEPYTRKQCVYI